MRYPALIDFDGDHIVAEFPDCPGCRVTAEPDADIVAVAAPVLQRWLTASLVDGAVPPRPSAAVVTRDWFEWVPVRPELARRLLLRWAAAKRVSRAELARRAGVTEAALAVLEDERARPSAKLLAGVARALGVIDGSDVTPAASAGKRPRSTAAGKRPRSAARPATRSR
jgi:hypothetical protein